MIIVIYLLCVGIYYNGPFPQCKLFVANQGQVSDLKSWYYSTMAMNTYVDMHENKRGFFVDHLQGNRFLPIALKKTIEHLVVTLAPVVVFFEAFCCC